MPKCQFLGSSIGKKIVLGLTGLALSLFLLTHVAGNLLILVSAEKFNRYALSLSDLGALLYVAEAGLIALFVVHMALAIRLSIQNRAARPQSYYMNVNTGRSRRTWGSSHMLITGLLILLFIIYHLIHFKFGETQMLSLQGREMRDLAGLVKSEFQELPEVLIYVFALLILLLHLRHGFRSLFETFGLAQSRFETLFRRFTTIYVYAVMGGFILIPLVIYFGGAR